MSKPIVLGGVHPTVFPEDAIQMADHIVLGEGEAPLLEWCREPERSDIENFWVRRDGQIFRNALRPARSDIDTLPFPDYGPDDHWILYRKKLRPVTPELLRRFMGVIYHQFATRGCPFSCTFCINNRLKRMGGQYGKFRHHSPDYIIEEIKYGLTLSPDIQYVNFPDDGFIAMKEGPLTEFAEKYKREIGLPFSVMGVIPPFLNQEKLDMLVDAGLKRVRLGLQSSSKSTLRFYKRPGDAELYRRCHEMIQSHPSLVFPYYDIIGDNPLVDGEKDMADTIEFLLSLKGPFALFLYSLRMYPGTEIYEQAKEQQVDRSYFDDSYFKFPNHLLNYIFTVIQCTSVRFLPRLLFALYRKVGNVRVPRFLFAINKLLFMLRLGVEHVRKKDASALPGAVVRLFTSLGILKRPKRLA